MLKEMAEEQGIDLDSFDIEDDEKLQTGFDEKTAARLMPCKSGRYEACII